ncbi:toll-like receptor 4 isoform X2 [Saccostrea echinata]|uniref:toll-like receptor 4 isoform X2 n=1 Tax=Saccostrea echinata TaxID=191078 RepID=UPI002A80F40A|nr:toll-like receptor 4 isoform X2 [Saccostrea echinata]
MAFGDYILVLFLTITCTHAEPDCIPNANCFYTFGDTIDCSSLNLQHPPCFSSSSNITHINLSNNYLEKFPVHLPTALEYLDLSYNRISGDSPMLYTIYRRLKYLNLDHNAITNLSFFSVISNMSNLESLSIKGNTDNLYSKYPNNLLVGLDSLSHLRIDGVQDGNFGDIFLEDKIESLKFLDASGYNCVCKISHLRWHVLDKFNLTYLDLSFCDIRSIEIGALNAQTYLQYLDVSYNQRLGFRGLANISYDLQNSAIKVFRLAKIHCTFGPFILFYFILLLNHTKYLHNTSLEELYLDSNRLEIMEIGVLPNLPKTLKHLSVGDNKMDDGMYVLQVNSLYNLVILNVSFQIYSHTNYFDGCNDYSYSCHIGPEVALLNTGQQQGSSNITFYLPKNLKRFYANNMKLHIRVGEVHFSDCNLEFVHFQNNFFVQIHGPIFGCDDVRYVDFSNNFCTFISAQVLKFSPKIEILNVSQNDLGFTLEKDINEVKRSQRKVFYEYDAFISYSEHDRRFVFKQFKKMESGGLRFCIHDRDFIPGKDIAENITNAIHNSRRTVCVITSHFLKSYWCMFELNMARMESIYSRGGDNILLLVLLENHIVREMPLSLLHVIESKSYLEYPDEEHFGSIGTFWRNLEHTIKDEE